MKRRIFVGIALALVMSAAPVMAASHEDISGKESAMFRALSKLPTGKRAVYIPLTDDQLASVEGEGSWSNRVVIEQMTKGGGTNIAIVKQKKGKRVVVKKQIGGHRTRKTVRLPKLPRVPVLVLLTGRVGAVVEQR